MGKSWKHPILQISFCWFFHKAIITVMIAEWWFSRVQSFYIDSLAIHCKEDLLHCLPSVFHLLIYSMDYQPWLSLFILKFMLFQMWLELSPCPLDMSWPNTSLMPGTKRHSRLLLHLSCPSTTSNHFSKELWFFSVENGYLETLAQQISHCF